MIIRLKLENKSLLRMSGYVSDVKVDSNNLTRSGYITPAVDFSKLQEVLVIATTKSELIKQESGSTKGE